MIRCERCKAPIGTSAVAPFRCEPCREVERHEREVKHARWRITPIYSVCSLGNNRWFWVAWPTRDAWFDQHPPAGTGYATSKAEAQTAAQVTVPGAIADRSNIAAYHHRRLSAEKRTKRLTDTPPQSAEAAPTEYLYTQWLSDYDDGRHWSAHRIIKRTAKRLFVVNHELSPEHIAQHPEDFTTIALDRQELEHKGEVWSKTARTHFYTEAAKQRCETEHTRLSVPACMAALGLSWPCTLDDVRCAWRKAVHQLHPDHNGEAAAFREMRTHYEAALRLAGGVQ